MSERVIACNLTMEEIGQLAEMVKKNGLSKIKIINHGAENQICIEKENTAAAPAPVVPAAPAPAAAKPAPAPAAAPKSAPAPTPTPAAAKPAPKPTPKLNNNFGFDLSEIEAMAKAIEADASKHGKGTPLNDGYDGNVDPKSIKLSNMG